MATTTLYPVLNDSPVSHTGFSGTPNIGNSAGQITATAIDNNTDNTSLWNLPTPPGNLTAAPANQQLYAEFRRHSLSQTGNPTGTLSMYENGTLSVTGGTTIAITAAAITGSTTCNFTADNVTDQTGAGVQAYMVGTKTGGSPGARNVAVPSLLRWSVNYTVAGTQYTETHTYSGIGTAAAVYVVARSRSFAINSSGVSALSRLGTFARSFTATATGGTVLGRASARLKAMSVTAQGASVLTKGKLFDRVLTFTASGLSALDRATQYVRSFSFTGSAAPAFARTASFLRSFAATAAGSPAVSRAIAMSRSFSGAGSAALAYGRTFMRSFAYTAAGAASFTQQFFAGVTQYVRSFSFTGTGAVSGASAEINGFGALNPDNHQDADTQPVNLATRFTSTIGGYITGVRFYRYSGSNGVSQVALYNALGEAQVAVKAVVGGGSIGWNTIYFDTPAAIVSSQEYQVVAHWIDGSYPASVFYFAAPVVTQNLSLFEGAYNYLGTIAYCPDSYNSSNYWTDPVFQATVGGGGLTKLVQLVRTFAGSGASTVSRAIAMSRAITAAGTSALAYGRAFLRSFGYAAAGAATMTKQEFIGALQYTRDLILSGAGAAVLAFTITRQRAFEFIGTGALAGGGGGAPALQDTLSEYLGNPGSVATSVGTVTPAGSNRFGIVKIAHFGAATVNQVMWGATDITANVIFNAPHDASNRKRYSWFYVLDPPTSATNVQATFSNAPGSVSFEVECWSNVDQTTPYGDLVATPAAQQENETPATITITATAGKTLTSGWFMWTNGGGTNTDVVHGAEQTETMSQISNHGGGPNTAALASAMAISDGSVTFSYNITVTGGTPDTNRSAIIAVSLTEAAGGGAAGLTKLVQLVRSVAGAGTATVSRAISMSRAIAASGTAALAYGRAFIRTFAYAAAGAAALTTQTFIGATQYVRSLVHAASGAASLAITVSYVHASAFAAVGTATITKRIAKTFAYAASATTSVTKRAGKVFAVAASAAVASTNGLVQTFAAAFTGSVVVVSTQTFIAGVGEVFRKGKLRNLIRTLTRPLSRGKRPVP